MLLCVSLERARKTVTIFRALGVKMEDIRPLAEEYFSSLNPIAKRILQDVRSTRENYESAW